MNTPPNGNNITDALADAMQAAKDAAEEQSNNASEPVAVEAAEGNLLVNASPDGTVAIELTPRALRLGSEQLSEEISQAVNDALTQLREKTNSAAGEEPVDMQGLSSNLQRLQKESAQHMQSFFDSLVDSNRRITEQRKGER